MTEVFVVQPLALPGSAKEVYDYLIAKKSKRAIKTPPDNSLSDNIMKKQV